MSKTAGNMETYLCTNLTRQGTYWEHAFQAVDLNHAKYKMFEYAGYVFAWNELEGWCLIAINDNTAGDEIVLLGGLGVREADALERALDHIKWKVEVAPQ